MREVLIMLFCVVFVVAAAPAVIADEPRYTPDGKCVIGVPAPAVVVAPGVYVRHPVLTAARRLLFGRVLVNVEPGQVRVAVEGVRPIRPHWRYHGE